MGKLHIIKILQNFFENKNKIWKERIIEPKNLSKRIFVWQKMEYIFLENFKFLLKWV